MTGVEIDSLTAAGDERIASSSIGQEYDVRGYGYLTIDATTTLTLRVAPLQPDLQTYQMSIIPNGEAVPSPRFTNCQQITPTSVETTEQIIGLAQASAIDQYRWYSLDLGSD